MIHGIIGPRYTGPADIPGASIVTHPIFGWQLNDLFIPGLDVGSNWRNYARPNSPATLTGSPSRTESPRGYAWYANNATATAASTYTTHTEQNSISTTGQTIELIARCNFADVVTTGYVYNTTNAMALSFGSAGFVSFSRTSSITLNMTGGVPNKWFHIVQVSSVPRTLHRIYVYDLCTMNVQFSSAASSGYVAGSNRFFGCQSATAGAARIEIAYFASYRAFAEPGNAMWLLANPWSFLEPRPLAVGKPPPGISDYFYTGSGGFRLTGAGDYSAEMRQTGSGGSLVAGNAPNSAKLTHVSMGGFTIGGLSQQAAEAVANGSGGFAVSGAGDVMGLHRNTASGGFTLGGTAPESSHLAVQASGGFAIAGSADYRPLATHRYEGTGGFAVGGASAESAHLAISGSSGTITSGSGPQANIIRETASGGFAFGGTADTQYHSSATYRYVGAGGLRTGGAGDTFRGTIVMTVSAALTKEIRRLIRNLPGAPETEMLNLLDQIQTESAITIDTAAEDAGNTPSTTLRAGIVMGIITSSGKYTVYDPDATDGTQKAVGVLKAAVNMISPAAGDKSGVLITQGRVTDPANADPRARQQLEAIGVNITNVTEVANMLDPSSVDRKGTNYTVTAAENGKLFLATAAATFTLPTKANGLRFRFLQTADANLAVSGAGTDVLSFNNAAATTVTCSTSGQKIGSQLLVECVYTAANTLKWIVTNLGATTLTLS